MAIKAIKAIKTKKRISHASVINKVKYPAAISNAADKTLLRKFIGRRKALLKQLEREFTGVTRDALLAIYLANKGDKKSFKRLVAVLLVGKHKKRAVLSKRITKNIDILYAEFNKYYQESLDYEQMGGAIIPGADDKPPGVVGGPYLERLTSKGDEPITGNDLAKALEEISTTLGNLQYLQDDGGSVFRGVNTWLNYFNGNPYPLKEYIRYYFAPQFYRPFPPSINFSEIYKRISNITDLLSTYGDDKYIHKQYLVEKGYTSGQTLKRSTFDKFVNQLSNLDNQYNKINMLRTGRMY